MNNMNVQTRTQREQARRLYKHLKNLVASKELTLSKMTDPYAKQSSNEFVASANCTTKWYITQCVNLDEQLSILEMKIAQEIDNQAISNEDYSILKDLITKHMGK